MRLRSSSRCGDEALIGQQFVDALRETLGLAPLYGDGRRTTLERFAVTGRNWTEDNGRRGTGIGCEG